MAAPGSVEKEEEKIVFTLIEKYEDVISALEEQNKQNKSQSQELSHTIGDVVNENSHLILELKDRLKNEISLLENEENEDDFRGQLENAIEEKEQILQAWQLALKEIERLEQLLGERDVRPDANNVEKTMKNEYIRIVTGLNATINDLREEIRHHENELNAKDVYATELRMMIESLKVQISDREQEIDALVTKENGLKQKVEDLKENATNLQLKATESLRESLDLKENNVALQEQTKGLINKNLSLEIRERELVQQMKESLQIAEDAMLEKDEAHMKIQHQQAEINRLKDALARIVDEAGLRTKNEVDKVQKIHANKITRLEDEIKSVEMKCAELRSEAERAAREKNNIEMHVEKLHKECERGELQQAYQQLHNRLVTTERNTSHVLLELDSNKAKMKLMQTCHDKEVNRWEIDKQHLEEKIKWLEIECETHLDGKVELAGQVEDFQAQIQELRQRVKTSEENLENYTKCVESEKSLEVQKWKKKLNSVEEYYQKMCEEFRELLAEQQNLGLRWKCETKRATQTWKNKFSEMQLELARYKHRNSELAALLDRANKVRHPKQSGLVPQNMAVFDSYGKTRNDEKKAIE